MKRNASGLGNAYWRITVYPLFQMSLQPTPTANLDRTDDPVYSDVMGLVKAVLRLKNEVSNHPPERYILVVKVCTFI